VTALTLRRLPGIIGELPDHVAHTREANDMVTRDESDELADRL
jgi:hypothetical protein